MKYCSKCGKQILDEAVICVHCGCAVNNAFSNRNSEKEKEEEYEDALNRLENKLHTTNTWWTVIYCIQFAIAALIFIAGIFTCIEEEEFAIFPIYIVASMVFFLIGVFNLSMTQKSVEFLNRIKREPTKIVEYFEPAGGAITDLILNILFGFIFGMVGSILHLCTRSFVMNNRRTFKEIEKNFRKKQSADSIIRTGARGYSAGAIRLQ